MSKNSLSFGRYLKTIRLEKGIDLNDVSKETKIGMDYLLLIEREDHNRLPAEVFVKGFLRAYAQAIEADGDEAVKRYLSSRRIFKEAVDFDADFIKSSKAYWPRLLVSVGVLLGIIVLSVFITPGIDQRPSEPILEKPVSAEIHRDTLPQDPEPSYPVENRFEDAADKLLLKVVAIEETWMKIIIDAQSPVEYSLKPGDLIELEAATGYNLLIGNAAGVHLTLNEKPVKIPGKRDQVVKLAIP